MIEVNNLQEFEEFLDKSNIPYSYYVTEDLYFVIEIGPNNFSNMYKYLSTFTSVGRTSSRDVLGIHGWDISFIGKWLTYYSLKQTVDKYRVPQGKVLIEYITMKDYQEMLNNDIRR